MKRTTSILITFFCLSLSFSQNLNTTVKGNKGDIKLLGEINREGLNQDKFKWFPSNYQDYVLDENILTLLKDSIQNYNIKAFLGTWCGDSKREVPRFYKILDVLNFPETQLKIYALDNDKETYKQSPSAEEQGLNIHRVPTFIFYKNKKEIGRIVESPIKTLERDIYQILTNETYSSNYKAVSYIEDILTTKGLDYLKLKEHELIPQLAEFIKGSRELNTYGYVKLRANKIEEALYIFELNTKIFPFAYNVYDSLGEASYMAKNYASALGHYNKVLELNPENDNAKSMIATIKSEMN